jgi:biopolymer transport protein ExbD
MGMQLGQGVNSNEPEVMMDINTTPLIDVMLVLLIMLIITIPPQLHSVNMDMPQVSPVKPRTDPVVIQVQVDADNAVRWNGKVLDGGSAALDERFHEAARQQPQPELHLRAHARAKYETVAAVLASAQRQGLNKLGILGSEQFAN